VRRRSNEGYGRVGVMSSEMTYRQQNKSKSERASRGRIGPRFQALCYGGEILATRAVKKSESNRRATVMITAEWPDGGVRYRCAISHLASMVDGEGMNGATAGFALAYALNR